MKKSDLARIRPFVVIVLCCLATAAHAAKTDVVILVNGDAITGEVKTLDFGTLNYSTDSMGTVQIDWEDIVALQSNQSLQIEVASGTRYFGNLLPAGRLKVIAVGRGENVQELDLKDVVRITTIDMDDKLWQRLEGSVSFGFDTDKASDVTNGHLNANVRYLTRTYVLNFEITSSFTNQQEAPTTEDHTYSLGYRRFRGDRWFTGWFGAAEKNDAQGIDRRLTAGGGLGRYLVQSNTNQFSLLGGLVATNEHYVGSDPNDTKAEAVVAAQYLHRRLEQANDISLTSNIFPLISDPSSYRWNSNLTVRQEIIDDLFFDLTMYYKYQTDPPAGANKEDYGVTTSIGYSF